VFAGTTFSDDADDPVGDHEGYADGVTATPLTPEGAMAQVHGEDPNGTWTLDVGDDGNLDTGMFNSWSLDLRILDPALTAFGPDSFNASPAAAIDDLTSFSGDLDVDTVGSICRIDVFTGIDHTFPGDLDIFLTSPSGTTTTLTTDNGVGNDDVYSDTQWTDTAALPATDFPYVDMMAASPVVPEGAFAIFNGEDPNGTWTLDVIDDAAVDSGMVNTWGIDVYVCECLPET
jgi:subtilisin-like proprotein convertase family protein